MTRPYIRNRIIVRGAGDVASGVIRCLLAAGFDVLALEKPDPDCVRRYVCFAEAFFEKKVSVEGFTAILVGNVEEAIITAESGQVPLIVDPKAETLPDLLPMAVIDARMLKENIDTTTDMAPIVIGLGPGFIAGKNCHAAIETIRGNDLGDVIYSGSPRADTGVPAPVDGISSQRVLRSPTDGKFTSNCRIGDRVSAGRIIGEVAGTPVIAEIDGVVRGIIHDGLTVSHRQKIGDIDPRGIRELCYRISDKSDAIGAGVLKALQTLINSLKN